MGFILGYYLKPVLFFAPAVFILFSALTSGAAKRRWVFFALLPWLVERLTYVLLAVFVAERAPSLFSGRSPIYVLCWISAWLVYLAYWRKFRPADDAAQPNFWPQRIRWVVIGAVALIAARYLAWLTRSDYPVGPWLLFWAIEIALIVAVVRASPKLPLRIAGAVLVIVLANWIAWLDNAIAEREFAKLCKEQAGTKIYKTVELGPEYFTPDGKPVFITSKGAIDNTHMPSGYRADKTTWEHIPFITSASRLRYVIRDTRDDIVIAEVTYLSASRGGPPGIVVEHRPMRGGLCPKDMSDMDPINFLTKVFLLRREQ